MTKEEREQYERDLAMVKQDGYALQFVQNQTSEICMAAVQKNGWAIKFVHDQTQEMCLIAVKRTGGSLYYVRDQTPEICLAAVQKYSPSLYHVHNIPALKQYILEQMNPLDTKRFSLFGDNQINSSDYEKLKKVLDDIEVMCT